MASVEDFIACPTEDFLDVRSREQLIRVAEHNGDRCW